MWLLNTTSLQLEWFVGPEADDLCYAILSHTWDSDEVSFQDIADLDVARGRAGFGKIRATCTLAQSQGYQYAWIDTCCINKQSSAELSEAINSMYYWYQAADVCYAYLSDLHEEPFKGLPRGFEELDGDDLDLLEDDVLGTPFAKCRWFTRGWTLQELIAPSHLVFYDASWRPINDKVALRYLLMLVTKIDAEMLVDNTNLSFQSVWRRMSWMGTRETSRTEDIAYCLLGIFDISMPLLYGEGYKAFQRLQEEITRKEGDPSILLWSPDRMPLRRYRPARYRSFTEPPVYRGAFAWAPSEFLTPEEYTRANITGARYDSNHVAVPARTEMGLQSSCVMQNGVICVMESRDETYFGKYLELQTSDGAVYRPIERMSDGYVFESRPFSRVQGVSLPSSVQELRLLGQHMTLLIESTKQQPIYLGIDDGGSIEVARVSWPQHRWEEDPMWWVYSNVEMSRVSPSMPTVLGVCRFSPQIWLMDPLGGPSLHQLTLACVVGSLPAPAGHEGQHTMKAVMSHLFGACLVKESAMTIASVLHREMGDDNMDAAVAVLQGHFRNNLGGFPSGRSETAELSGLNGSKKRIRVVCTYSGTPVLHNSGLSWRIRLGLEHEEGYGSEKWSEASWDDLLPA